MSVGPSSILSSISNVEELSPRSVVLLSAYLLRRDGQTNFNSSDISDFLVQAGLKPPQFLSQVIGQLTRGAKSPLMKIEDRYSLTLHGEQEIQHYLDSASLGSVPTGTRVLDQLLGKLQSDIQNNFLSEVAACIKFRAKRASMVLAWCLTIEHLKQYILAVKLADFNTALSKRSDSKGLVISQYDDFLEIKNEAVFIETCRSANIVTNDVRKILDAALGYRNTCAHPNDIKISESKVVGHVEELVENVVMKYPLAVSTPSKSPNKKKIKHKKRK